MIQNVKAVPKKDLAPPCTRSEELAAYDSLPPELREVIRETPLSLSAISMYNEWIFFGDMCIKELIQAAKDTAWGIVYENPLGPNYPRLVESFPHPDAKARRKPPKR